MLNFNVEILSQNIYLTKSLQHLVSTTKQLIFEKNLKILLFETLSNIQFNPMEQTTT